jgi:hypothetical protein
MKSNKLCELVIKFYLGFFLIMVSLTFGCAYQYVDEIGSRHTWGLTHVVTREINREMSDVSMHQFSTFGVAILKDRKDLGVSLGYTRDFKMSVDDHVAGQLWMNWGVPAKFKYDDTYQILKENQLCFSGNQ